MSLVSLLAHHIRTHGPIPTARVSSAQSGTRYAYWGVVRYEIRLRRDGAPTNAPLGRASSDRRSRRLAERDLDELCEAEGRVVCEGIGQIPEESAESWLAGCGYDAAIQRHHSRRSSPRPLTLSERLTVHLAGRAGLDRGEVEGHIRSGSARRSMRWLALTIRGRCILHYLPYGDARDQVEFAGERNQERRRRIWEACGERVAPPARTLVQQDDYGQLWEVSRYTSGRDRVSREVRVVCPSTGAVYWLPVSEYCQTAHAAVASTFGLAAGEYAPVAQA